MRGPVVGRRTLAEANSCTIWSTSFMSTGASARIDGSGVFFFAQLLLPAVAEVDEVDEVAAAATATSTSTLLVLIFCDRTRHYVRRCAAATTTSTTTAISCQRNCRYTTTLIRPSCAAHSMCGGGFFVFCHLVSSLFRNILIIWFMYVCVP